MPALNPLSSSLRNNSPWNKTSYIPFSGKQLETLFQKMDNSKELHRAGVVFIDRKLNFTELRVTCRADQKSIILIERIRVAKKTVAAPPKEPGSTMSSEVKNVAWTCGSTAITWLVLVGEGAAGFETLGAAWTLMPATTASAIASSAACGITVGRLFNVTTGSPHYNDWIDQDPIFTGLMIALDIIQLIDVANAVGKQSTKLIARFRGHSKPSIVKMYTQMSRAARIKLAAELLQINDRSMLKVHAALKPLLNGQRQLANGQATIKVYSQMQLKFLAKSGVLDIIGSAITTGGSARPGGGAIDKVNRKRIEILVGITE